MPQLDKLIDEVATMWINSQGWGKGLTLDEVNCADEARDFARKVIESVNSYKQSSACEHNYMISWELPFDISVDCTKCGAKHPDHFQTKTTDSK